MSRSKRARGDRPRTRKRGRGGIASRYNAPPAVAEIRSLSLWDMVALAARCAEDVRPLLPLFWQTVPQRHANAVESAVRLAATSAGIRATYANEAEEAALAADAVALAAEAADTG